MPSLTQPERPPARPAAARLPQPSTRPSRGRDILLGSLSALGIAALVLGLPAALVYFVGYPLPRSAPSRDWLTTSITATLIIKTLACVVWVVWAHFVVCLLSEWRSLRRGRMPSVVPLGGGSQLLARRLVATALLLSGAAMLVPHGGDTGTSRPMTASGAHAGTSIVSNSASDRTVVGTPAIFNTSANSGAAKFATDGTVDSGSATTASAGKTTQTKYYVVSPPEGRRHDCLWDIAERTLGDPLRYKEIYALNHDRIQPDGSKLTDANLIRPGWQLILPADASGPGVHVVTQSTAPAPVPGPAPKPYETPTTPKPSATPSSATPSSASPTPSTQESTPAIASAEASPADAGGPGVGTAVGSGLIVAGLAVAVSTRRGPYVAASGEEESFAVGGSAELAELLDRALRNLAHSRATQARSLPHLAVAWVSPTQIVLNFLGGDIESPPPPWRVGDEERAWLLNPTELIGPCDAPAPYPGLVNVGTGHGYEVLIDLEQAPGVISVGGVTDVAREIVSAMAVQPAINRWSDGARVTFVGFADAEQMRQISPANIFVAANVGEAIALATGDRDEQLKVQRELGIDGVLIGRQRRRDLDWRPSLIVLSAPPTAEEAVRLHELTRTERGDVIALVVGDAPSARWRFATDAAGSLDLGVFGTSVQAHRLSAASAALVAQMAQAADQARIAAVSELRMTTPGSLVAQDPRLRTQHGVAAVRVRLLGPVEVTAPGPLAPAAKALATEVVVAVALAQDGLHDAVLRSSIWPRGVSDAIVAAVMADVAGWLGTETDGTPRIYRGNDGRWRLSPEVHTDVVTLAQWAAAAHGAEEVASLQSALALFAGEAFSSDGTGRYSWGQFRSTARDTRILATSMVCRLADLLHADGRFSEAASALRAGLRLIPTSEVLWQRLLVLPPQVISPADPTNGSRAVAQQMYATLRSHGVWPDQQTDALVAHLVPGYEVGAYAPSPVSV